MQTKLAHCEEALEKSVISDERIKEAEEKAVSKFKLVRNKECKEIATKINGLELQLKNALAVAKGHKIAIARIINTVRLTNKQYLRIWHNELTITPRA